MRVLAPLLLILMGWFVAGVASAEPRRDHRREGRMEFRNDEQGLSLRDAAATRAQRQHGGRVLSADPDGYGGYRVKLLKAGEVRTVHVPP